MSYVSSLCRCPYLCSCVSSVCHSLNTPFVTILVSSFLDPCVYRDTEMLLGWKPKSHLDLLHPDVEEKVRIQQGKQKAWHDRHARAQSFHEGETVLVRNFARGQRWLPGAIMEKKSGPRSCVVRLLDSLICRWAGGPSSSG